MLVIGVKGRKRRRKNKKNLKKDLTLLKGLSKYAYKPDAITGVSPRSSPACMRFG